jgi:hypothetical protein
VTNEAQQRLEAEVVETLRKENAALRAENERLRGLLKVDPQVVQMMFSSADGLGAELQHWGVVALAASLWDSLGEAPNFVTFEVGHPEKGGLVVTVQRKHGMSPAEVLEEQRVRIADLLGSLGTVLPSSDAVYVFVTIRLTPAKPASTTRYGTDSTSSPSLIPPAAGPPGCTGSAPSRRPRPAPPVGRGECPSTTH